MWYYIRLCIINQFHIISFYTQNSHIFFLFIKFYSGKGYFFKVLISCICITKSLTSIPSNHKVKSRNEENSYGTEIRYGLEEYRDEDVEKEKKRKRESFMHTECGVDR